MPRTSSGTFCGIGSITDMRSSLIILLTILVPAFAGAAEIRTVHVEHQGKRYTMESEVAFDVGLRALYEVFLDYDLSPEFSSWVVDARNLEREDGRRGYFVQNRGCILFVCQTTVREGVVEHEPFLRIEATADPALSDFEVSNERWVFREEDGATIVTYYLEMEPKFWVPPVIGPYVIKRKLRSSGNDALDRIEEIAQQRDAE